MAKKIANKYCDWTAELLDLYPWKCNIDATEQPPDYPAALERRRSGAITPSPTYVPTKFHPCLYLNITNVEDSSPDWTGMYERIWDPYFKNGKAHYSGPTGNEIYWADQGLFQERWILSITVGYVLASIQDGVDSDDVPDLVIWQSVQSCASNCLDIGDDVNISVTHLLECAPTNAPTTSESEPTSPPTSDRTSAPTSSPTLDTSSPTLSTMNSPISSQTFSSTNSPTEVPTKDPTVQPTTEEKRETGNMARWYGAIIGSVGVLVLGLVVSNFYCPP